ncbi:MAG: type IV fimbrial biogenesis protein FimT [Paraglaciecola sp.]
MQILSKQTGVTLIELMVSVSIVGVLATSVAPSMQNILIKNSITAQMNELSAVAQYARSHAINQQIDTVLCPSSDFASCSNNWQQGKMVFVDSNADGMRNDNEELLVAKSAVSEPSIVTGPANALRFLANGATNTPGKILFCSGAGDNTQARALLISLQGRVKTSVDSDNNGVHEDADGTPLSCS